MNADLMNKNYGTHRKDRGDNPMTGNFYEPPPTGDATKGHPRLTWSFSLKTHSLSDALETQGYHSKPLISRQHCEEIQQVVTKPMYM